ncbi:MAG TPA: cupin domain-containing protein [Nitrososphaeraceae archaeon]|jgi:predicted cupin superfamily sugar epimerase|nr:cupin domain-containing protein [Nitrososphaeraceae archaeon]
MYTKSCADYWIQKLQLSKHPEGGYYRETYRSDNGFDLLTGSSGIHSISSAIYFLLDRQQFSAFHRIKSDEIWHFYTGSSLILYVLENKDIVSRLILGKDIDAGEEFQAVIKSGSWFGAIVSDCSSYSLVGCTTSPAFNFENFELGKRENLLQIYPKHKAIIERLTKKDV